MTPTQLQSETPLGDFAAWVSQQTDLTTYTSPANGQTIELRISDFSPFLCELIGVYLATL